MKQFISKAKNLSQRAAELKAAMQQLPPKIAEVRETVAATAGQLQQLKSEIQYSVADLAVDDEQRLTEALREIDASSGIFTKAGFRLNGVDLEISPIQRMLVHLAKLEDVHPSVLRSLLSANKERRTTHAILSSLLQAQQMAESVKLSDLSFVEVGVGVGPVPSVRLRWRAEAGEEAATEAPAVQAIPGSPPLAASAPVTPSAFSQGSFFEKRQPQPVPVTRQTTTAPVPTVQVSTPLTAPAEKPTAIESAQHPEEHVDPLARFKKMPELAKFKR